MEVQEEAGHALAMLSGGNGDQGAEEIFIARGAHREIVKGVITLISLTLILTLNDLLKGLIRHKEDARVMVALSGALWRSTYTEESHRIAVEEGAPDALLAAMRFHQAGDAVQVALAEATRAVIEGS